MKRREALRNIRLMYIFLFICSLHFIGGTLVPFYTEWAKITFTQMMMLQSWFIFWAALLSIPCGSLADIWGRKKCLILGSLITTAGAWVYISLRNFYIFMLGEFLLAAGMTLINDPSTALIYESLKALELTREELKKEADKVFRNTRSLSLAAILISTPLGSVAASQFDLRAPLFLLGITFALGGGLAVLFSETKRCKERQLVKISVFFETMKDGFKELTSCPKLLKLALDFAVVDSLCKMMLWLYQPLLLKLDFSIMQIGWIHTAVVGMEISTILCLGKLERFMGRSRVLLVTSLLPGLALLYSGAFSLNSEKWIALSGALIGAFVVIGIGLSRGPLFNTEFNEQIESDEKRSTILGATYMLPKILSAILNPLVGRLGDFSPSLTIFALGVLLTNHVILSNLWMRKKTSR